MGERGYEQGAPAPGIAPREALNGAPQRVGPYSVVRLVGRGGTASVYEGRRASNGAPVAIKIPHPHLARDSAFAARFLREAQNLARISHPHVIEVLDAGQHDGHPYLVMAFARGDDLSEHARRLSPMLLPQITECLLPVIDAVGAAHRAGVVHRDLKPSNIRVTIEDDGRVVPKVLDFGVSKVAHDIMALDITETGKAVGTIAYMAPEQLLSSKRTDVHCDVYALGVILYECATGRRPFQGETPYGLMHAILTADVVPPSSLRPDLPVELDEVVLRALCREPSERYATAKELGRALESVAEGHARAARSGVRASGWRNAASERVQTVVVGRVFLVYWMGTPDPDSLRQVVRKLELASASALTPFIGCAYAPDRVGPPPSSVRRLILQLTPKMLESCESIHAVQPGPSVVSTLFRAAARAMVIAGGFGGRVFVHSSLEDFLVRTQDRLGATPADVRREVERIEAQIKTQPAVPAA